MGVITYILAITKLHSEDIDRVQNQAHQRERRQRKIIRNKKEKKETRKSNSERRYQKKQEPRGYENRKSNKPQVSNTGESSV